LRPIRELFVCGLVAAALLLAIGFRPGPIPASPSRTAACPGKWRWPVKTLSDDLASSVNFTPKLKTVAYLNGLPKPSVKLTIGSKDVPRQTGPERKTYRVEAALVKMKREDDGDYHLVIADRGHPTGRRMVVEFPDATCDGAATSKKRSAMAAARKALKDGCKKTPPSSFKRGMLEGTAIVTGVGFFDFLHAGDQAKNGIELHPVLGFKNVVCKVLPPP
jgi:hypothetical protein